MVNNYGTQGVNQQIIGQPVQIGNGPVVTFPNVQYGGVINQLHSSQPLMIIK